MTDCLIDNDVVLKSVSYGFLDELIAGLPGGPHVPGLLGTARFVLPKRLQRRPPKQYEQAREALSRVLAIFEAVEPSDAEAALAATLEYEAQRQAVAVDAGECQLIAILVSRGYNWLLTGDKRALAGLAAMVLPSELSSDALAGKFMCFEQAILHLVAAQGSAWVRHAICHEPDVDIAMRICFSCTSPEVTDASWKEGLNSQVQSIRGGCGDLLLP